MDQRIISITATDVEHTVRVAYHDPRDHDVLVASRDVHVGPNPTWPSPSETSDLIADAVRDVLDAAYYAFTGDRIER